MANAVALTEGVTAALNEEAVSRIAGDEPEWLRERRAHAWSVYEATPMPSTRLEQWRYTDLKKKLDLDSLRLPQGAPAPDDRASWPKPLRAALDADREASGHIVVIDGHVVHADVDASLAKQGVIVMSLHDAVEEHPALVQKHLATDAVPAEEGKFAALNAALWADGVFLYVPKGVRLEVPVRVTRWFTEPGAAYLSRVLIVAERESQVSYVDEVLSDDFAQQMFTSTAVEVIARDGALPISTFGGLKARGNPAGATGIYQIVEVAQQLRGDAGDCQVPGARIGMAQNVGTTGATAVTHILRS